MGTIKNVEDIKRYYDELYLEGQEKTMRPMEAYKVFIDILAPKRGGKILDIGCGTGYLLKIAQERGLTTYGLDISSEAVKIAKKASPKSCVFIGGGENLPFPNEFLDYIVCLGSLEHFSDIDHALHEMVRVLKKNGRSCIMVPNINYRFGAGTDQIEEKLLTLNEWKKLLEKNGMDVVKVKQDKYFAKQLTWRRIAKQKGFKGKLRLLKKKFIWAFIPLEEAYQFIFICNPNKPTGSIA